MSKTQIWPPDSIRNYINVTCGVSKIYLCLLLNTRIFIVSLILHSSTYIFFLHNNVYRFAPLHLHRHKCWLREKPFLCLSRRPPFTGLACCHSLDSSHTRSDTWILSYDFCTQRSPSPFCSLTHSKGQSHWRGLKDSHSHSKRSLRDGKYTPTTKWFNSLSSK